MTTTQHSPRFNRNIPKHLIYEKWGGKIYYRKGYRDILKSPKNSNAIMGSSSLQSIIVAYLVGIIFSKLPRQKYFLLTNEAGIHLDKNDNMAGDVIIYDKAVLPPHEVSLHYANVPPKIVIEVDIEVELKNETELDYIFRKADRLLHFGTEKVIWIFSKIQKIFVFENNQEPVIWGWNKNIDVLEGITFNVAQFLEEEGINLPINE